MGLSVIPTNIGGVNIPLAQLQGPLSKLFQDQSSQNLTFPADLASNPAMGHAVMFSIFDYESGFAEDTAKVAGTAYDTGAQFMNDIKSGITKESLTNAVTNAGAALPSAANLTMAKTYTRQKKTNLATVSLFMPDTLNIGYNASYSEVSLTQGLGLAGFLGNALTDAKTNQLKGYAITGMAQIAQKALGLVPFSNPQDIGGLIGQSAGVIVNPQIQLLFKAVALRTFQLEFMLTPKSSKEAETIKNICDTLTYYSLPGLGGSQLGKSGQFLTPPQIFKIDFKFLGQTGILGNISNIISTALNNSGLSLPS